MTDWLNLNFIDSLRLGGEGMLHGGLPTAWVTVTLAGMVAALIFIQPRQLTHRQGTVAQYTTAFLYGVGRLVMISPHWLIAMRVLATAIFLLVIAAGLFGTAIPERNLATTLTWTLWWTGVIIAIYFTGSSWCAICPWDTLANWLVRQRIWFKSSIAKGLNLRVPKWLRTVWPASAMFIGLTWLELGLGITTSPYATAVLALTMVTMTTISLLIFERKAFCRYFCSIGRTIGAYAELSPFAVRPLQHDVCAQCKTLDCYHGNETIDPCPTHLVIGRGEEIRYCTSCGACVFSCPHHNVGWRWQSNPLQRFLNTHMNSSEAWFILILLALTSFHGITMLPIWESMVHATASWLNDRGQLMMTFSLFMLLALFIPAIIYSVAIKITSLTSSGIEHHRLLNQFSLPLLPIAFCYHIAHNLTHLTRESQGFITVLANPLGTNTLPLSMMEKHQRHLYPLLPDNMIFTLQSILMLLGFIWSIRLFQQRRVQLYLSSIKTLPILMVIIGASLFNLWLLLQPMIMRM